jgi:NAD(P)-dependent dehydrogenase (short-subunit alcohol dehydrogenase family)
LTHSLTHLTAHTHTQTHTQVHVFQCNVRSEEEIKALVRFALEKMGRIDGLVNNAGGELWVVGGLMCVLSDEHFTPGAV